MFGHLKVTLQVDGQVYMFKYRTIGSSNMWSICDLGSLHLYAGSIWPQQKLHIRKYLWTTCFTKHSDKTILLLCLLLVKRFLLHPTHSSCLFSQPCHVSHCFSPKTNLVHTINQTSYGPMSLSSHASWNYSHYTNHAPHTSLSVPFPPHSFVLHILLTSRSVSLPSH